MSAWTKFTCDEPSCIRPASFRILRQRLPEPLDDFDGVPEDYAVQSPLVVIDTCAEHAAVVHIDGAGTWTFRYKAVAA